MANFNEEQLKVINTRGSSILVSAAAGSGKTTVLVERIIRRISDEKDPINIDELLVLTFTKAAAGEMRQRISAAIDEALQMDPDNEHLRRQEALVYNAKITTIDSFCLNLLKNNFAEIGLEPGFRTANENEMKFIMDEVLDETMEEILGSHSIEYLDEFLGYFESKDNITKVKNIISETYAKACNAPFVEDYIDNRRYDYALDETGTLDEIQWARDYLAMMHTYLQGVLSSIEEFRTVIVNSGYDGYLATCDADEEVVKALLECESYAAMKKVAETVSLPRLASIKGVDEEVRNAIKSKRESYKKVLDKKIFDVLKLYDDELTTRMEKTSHVINALMDAVSLYHNKLTEAKLKKNIVTFSDMEHMALKILLCKNEKGEYEPTQTALDYRLGFKEIMIDEYQDSNDTQEMMLSCLSSESENVYNRFIVGDMKQSIYRFRNAKPDIFRNKYDSYSKEAGAPYYRIDLSKNYRSRASVIECVNAVFEKMMAVDLGGIAYDEDSRLYTAGTFPETDMDTKATLMLVEQSPDSGDDKDALESMLIAQKINELIRTYKVCDKATGEMRECTYRDIVILLRGGSEYAENLYNTLTGAGIPAYVTSKSGYFDAVEIVDILNYLAILDNPSNDIPMFGALTGPFGTMDEEQVTLLHILQPGNCLVEALNTVELTSLEELIEKLPQIDSEKLAQLKNAVTVFLSAFNEYRKLVPYTPIHKLIRRLIKDNNYYTAIDSSPQGQQKHANVAMLLNKAQKFESDGFRGLFAFNRYIEKLHKYGYDDGDAAVLDENADVVRIMTMHKSKGLEFPVVILANLGKQLNLKDGDGDVIFHDRFGIGLKYIDAKRRSKMEDLRRKYISECIKADSIAEEIRILYVAMTRPKEKLIMTACVKDLEKVTQVSEACMPDNSGVSKPLPYLERLSCGSFLDMIMKSRGHNDWNGQLALETYRYEDIVTGEVSDRVDDNVRKEQLGALIKKGKGDESLINRLRERADWRYGYEYLSKLYTKTSVSELKMASIHDELISGELESVPETFMQLHEQQQYVPDFIGETNDTPSGAMRGSAYHRVMELIPYATLKVDEDYTEAILDEHMNRMIAEGRIAAEGYALVNRSKICDFVNSKLGKRMIDAAKQGNLYLEQPFVLGIGADRLSKDYTSDETVLIQGIIDVFFIENGEAVLLDYKTDSVKNADELIKRYQTQLDYYDEAITRIMDIKVKERIIYSFSLGAVISM